MTEPLDGPFADNQRSDQAQDPDQILSARALAGDSESLTSLIRQHQRWIYNVALRLVANPADAEDLAQETLLRIITHLGQFQGRAAFRTWAYRILVNRFLDGKRRKTEQMVTTFSAFGKELDTMGLDPLELPRELEPERSLIVEDAMVSCMFGMLLCLDRPQRAVYVLGEVFSAPSKVAAQIMDMTPAAFRKRLERARRDLTNFMNDKCGLLKEANPCRCELKTKAFIREGFVDPRNLKFTTRHVTRLKKSAPGRSRALHALTKNHYADLFRNHPILSGPDLASRLNELVREPELRRTFGLGPPD